MKILHMTVRKRRQKVLRVSNFALLLVVFKWHHGSEGVNKKKYRSKTTRVQWGIKTALSVAVSAHGVPSYSFLFGEVPSEAMVVMHRAKLPTAKRNSNNCSSQLRQTYCALPVHKELDHLCVVQGCSFVEGSGLLAVDHINASWILHQESSDANVAWCGCQVQRVHVVLPWPVHFRTCTSQIIISGLAVSVPAHYSL